MAALMARKPLAIDLYAGLGGWTDGLLAEGWDVIGFDIEQHAYWVPEDDSGPVDGGKGTKPVAKRGWTQGCAVTLGMEGAGARPRTKLERYPAQLVIQDVLTIHGSQFRNADLIVASPPCQAYSYMAMPWSLAKAKAAAIKADETGAALTDLNALFNACFRIQREASAAAGRHIPMVVENVRGAQPWVGRARWSFGSFYLWGDVPALMPSPSAAQKYNPDGTQHGPGEAIKVPGFRFDGSGGSFQTAAVQSGIKAGGKGDAFATYGTGLPRDQASKSPARKAASARIAKIPEALSRYIARHYYPRADARAA